MAKYLLAALVVLGACLLFVHQRVSHAQTGVVTPSTSRPSERPALNDQAAKTLATELRTVYSKPVDQWPEPQVDPTAHFTELGPTPEVKFPEDNPWSQDKADLGRQLFFDARLSGSGQMACASCHDPDLGWADGRTVAFGHERQALKRNAPSILNTAFFPHLFWDGRAKTLEEQAQMPLLALDEMHADEDVILERLRAIEGYRQQFKAVFGTEEITFDHIAKAIATFERTVISRSNKFDSFMNGNPNALSDSAVRGLHLFRTDARCINCHNGPLFMDGQFHEMGLSHRGRPFEDLGLYEITKKPKDSGKFKTPGLRNVTRTEPYMHNGLFEIDPLLMLYNAGMPNPRRRADQVDDELFPTKDVLLKPLGLNDQDIEDLKSFLRSLEEPRNRVRPPKLPK